MKPRILERGVKVAEAGEAGFSLSVGREDDDAVGINEGFLRQRGVEDGLPSVDSGY